ncbi:hypothetical protein EZI54_16560 [Marinobacter halodurans]|uniref:DUF3613 domain-containing protein n=1 Tax=Marinobacter halodurans TaxID=2528979 RepID=A0ABY1ZIW1_9GAMM|nr:hypothetical protein [Marinobacter halodurans]TBW51850.1 hypothetical protein EZI54_16560 [Marinobacter halodurans]
MKTHLLILLCLPAMAMAADPPDHGLSGDVVGTAKNTRTEQLLDRQVRDSRPGQELSLELFVDTQKRLAESFRRPIPDDIRESTREKK